MTPDEIARRGEEVATSGAFRDLLAALMAGKPFEIHLEAVAHLTGLPRGDVLEEAERRVRFGPVAW